MRYRIKSQHCGRHTEAGRDAERAGADGFCHASRRLRRSARREFFDLTRPDCRHVLPTLAGIDAVVTDPPYGVGWDTDYQFSPHNSSVREAAIKMGRHKGPPGRCGAVI